MSEWYYAHAGEQKGPVPVSELRRLAENGEFDPTADLVWREGMDDWKPASTVEELGGAFVPPNSEAPGPDGATTPAPAADANPYASPITTETQAPSAGPGFGDEIPPGSQPIEFAACISRGFELTKRHFGIIIATGAVYLGLTFGLGMILGAVEVALGGGQASGGSFEFDSNGSNFDFDSAPAGGERSSPITAVSIFTNIISQVFSIFLSLGVTRIGLNLVDNKPASVGMIFGGGQYLLRGIGAGILYGLMVAAGLILFIVPGIYLALRFGQYQNAIVDRDMGVFESFAYSSSITTNNRLNLFILAILSVLIVIAGMIALFVGLIFAYPIVWLAAIVAYRWMQYGPKAAMDSV
jgi:hypothetical protein